MREVWRRFRKVKLSLRENHREREVHFSRREVQIAMRKVRPEIREVNKQMQEMTS